jgi:chromosome partitioning protein
MRILAIINLKGGTGKSVTAVNLSYLLAHEHHKRVLLIDADKQGNSGAFYGAATPGMKTLADVLGGEIALGDAVNRWGDSKLWVLPSSLELLTLERKLLSRDSFDSTILRDKLRDVAFEYDYCIIDCAPALDLAALSALCAADHVLIPTRCDAFSLAGAQMILDQVTALDKAYGHEIRAHILLTQYQRSKVCAQFYEMLHARYSALALDTTIASSVKVPESLYTKQPLAVYAPKARVSRDYVALCREMIARMDGGDQ